MDATNSDFIEALTKIGEVVDQALRRCGQDDHGSTPADTEEAGEPLSCTPRALPDRLQVTAAEVAYLINPVNAPAMAAFSEPAEGFEVIGPQRIAVLTSKYWGPKSRTLTVSFMESAPADLRRRIVSHLNAWTKSGCVSFAETSGTGMVRISRGGGGYYSYLGTDVLLIPKNRQTMNLQGFTMNTSENEFKRVVRHEAGHTLGFPHEHMRRALVDRIDRKKAYAYFLRTQGWDSATVDAQVLTPLDERSLMATPADQTSIMCYQLPGSITKDGKPILGGLDINATDHAFVGKIYPRAVGGTQAPGPDHGSCGSSAPYGQWGETDDVEVAEAVSGIA